MLHTLTETAKAIEQVLRDQACPCRRTPDDFTMITRSRSAEDVGPTQRVLFLYLPLVAGISPLAGGIVAATLMLAR